MYGSELLLRMARGRDRRIGYEEVTGDTTDISKWIDFEMYDLVYWIDRPNKPDTSDDVRRLGRCLGISHLVGSDMCYLFITESGKLVSKTLVDHVIRDDYLNPDIKKQIGEFNDKLDKRLDDTKFLLEDSPHSVDLDYDDDNHNQGVIKNHRITLSDDEYGDMLTDDRPESDDEEAFNNYLTCELIMDVGSGNERKGRVTKRSRVHDGKPMGVTHNNPLFDTG